MLMKKFFSLLLSVVAATTAWAQTTFTSGDFTYTVTDADAKTVSVKQANNQVGGDLVIPATAQNDGVSYSVTSIAESGFKDNANITSVVFPANMRSTGKSCFENCKNIASITLNDGLETIGDYLLCMQSGGNSNAKLTAVTIPSTVTSIGRGAFYNCTALAEITFSGTDEPITLNHASYAVFGNCPATKVNLDRDIEGSTVADFPTVQTLVVGGYVTKLHENMFRGCKQLTSVTLGSNLTEVGKACFYGCSELTAIDISESLATISESMFEGCTKLASVTLKGGLSTVGKDAFYNCALTSVTLPASVTSVGRQAFQGCPIEEFNISDCDEALTISAYSKILGKYFYIGRNLTFTEGTSIFSDVQTLVVGDDVTKLNENMFWGCTQLTSVTLGSNLTEVGKACFQGCSELTAIDIPASLATISESMFEKCKKLASVTLHEGLSTVGKDAFYNCNLTSVTLPASVTSVGREAFQGCPIDTFRISDSQTPLSISAYSTIRGKTFYLGRNLTFTEGTSIFSDVQTLVVGDNVTKLNENMFKYCKQLDSVTLGSNLAEVGKQCFYGCLALTAIDIPASLDTISESMFEGCTKLISVTLHEGLSTVGKDAFYNCHLTSVTLPASVTSVGREAFQGCPIDTFHISDSQTPLSISAYSTIPGKTFYIGRNLTFTEGTSMFGNVESLTLGGSMTTIPENFAQGKSTLKTLVVGEGIVNIVGAAAFRETGLTSVSLPSTLKVLPKETFEKCYSLATVTLAEGLEEIGHGAFYDCKALKEITLPASLKKIGTCVFQRNENLKKMVIADSDTALSYATGIHKYGVLNMTPAHTLDHIYVGRNIVRIDNLSNSIIAYAKVVELGEKVTSLGQLMPGTGNVSDIYVPWTTPIEQTEDICKGNYGDITLWVPGGTKEAYQAADIWKKFTKMNHHSTLVTLTASAHGTIANEKATAAGGSAQYRQAKDAPVAYTLTADTGYEPTALTDNGNPVSPLPDLGTAQSRANSEGEEYVTLAATFSPISYTLTYDLAGGAAAENPASYTIESDAITLVNPTREGYTFAGWTGTNLSEATVSVTIAKGSTDNRSYTATWTPIIYTITCDLAGGAAVENPASYTIESDAITLVNPTREGYTFNGWLLDGEGEAQMNVIIDKGSTGNKSYTATWKINSYTIYFEDCSDEVAPIVQEYGTAITPPDDPTREGYDFIGWNPELPKTMPAGDLTVTATWQIKHYTVTITGGGVTADNYSPEYGAYVMLTILPDSDTELASLLVNNVDVTSQIADYRYIIEEVTGDVTVVATWKSSKEFITMTNGQASFSCDRDLDFSEVYGLTAYIASGFDRDGTVQLSKVDVVPANTGLFLVGTEGLTYKVPYATATSYYVNLLKPNLTAKVVPATEGGYTNFLYGKNNGVAGFYKASGTGELAAKKAYLQVPTSVAAAKSSLKIRFTDDDLTGIGRTRVDGMSGKGVYDLKGRKVADKLEGTRLPSGIYIVNGKKVYVK